MSYAPRHPSAFRAFTTALFSSSSFAGSFGLAGEDFDLGGEQSGGIFTAAKGGDYYFVFMALATASFSALFRINSPGGSAEVRAWALTTQTGRIGWTIPTVVHLEPGQTASIHIESTNSNIEAGAIFAGFLIQ